MKVTKLSDYQPGVQPIDYHKFDEDQWDKALIRGERIARIVVLAGVVLLAGGLGALVFWLIL